MSSSTTEKSTAAAPCREDLRGVIERDLCAPIAALRATLGDLERELGAHSAAGALVHGALEQLIAVDRRAEALVELLLPQPLRPLQCSLGEIARSAWCALPPPHRARVWLAIEDAERALEVDGPVLVRSLAGLLEEATEESEREVLLHAHCENGALLQFAIVAGLEGTAPLASVGAAAQRESLAARLACRDVARLGGALSRSEPGDPQRLTILQVPALGGRA